MAIPEGHAATPLKALRLSLSKSSAFQALVGAKSDIAALDFIYYVSNPAAIQPPFAVVDVLEADWQRVGVGSFTQNGRVEVIVRQPIADSADAEQGNELINFLNVIGTVIREILALTAGPECFLNIVGLRHSTPVRPPRNERANIGDFYEIVLEVVYEGGF
jgi:hypothetical protein